jgi:hypothetical protein
LFHIFLSSVIFSMHFRSLPHFLSFLTRNKNLKKKKKPGTVSSYLSAWSLARSAWPGGECGPWHGSQSSYLPSPPKDQDSNPHRFLSITAQLYSPCFISLKPSCHRGMVLTIIRGNDPCAELKECNGSTLFFLKLWL